MFQGIRQGIILKVQLKGGVNLSNVFMGGLIGLWVVNGVETKLDCRPRFGAPEQCEAHTFVFFLDGVVYGRPQPRRAH